MNFAIDESILAQIFTELCDAPRTVLVYKHV